MASFLGEIKRPKVFQVAVVYIVVVWVTIQIIDVVGEPLRLPDWVATVVIVLLAAGFPIALILAWAFDLTTDGIAGADVDCCPNGRSIPQSHPIRHRYSLCAVLS